MKRLLASLLASALVISLLPAQVLAAEFSVSSGAELESSWNTANSNADSSNTFNMTANIDMGNRFLETETGKSYTVNGNGNTLSNVSISAGDSSISNVQINADITGTTQSALYVTGDTSVNVTGDIHGEDFAVVIANDDAYVNIKGDISTEAQGVMAQNGAILAIAGDITVEDTGANNQAIVANDGTVRVYGNVNSGELGVMAMDGTVNIYGNINDMGGSGLNSGSTMTVTGNYTSDMDTPIYNDGQNDYYGGVNLDSNSSLTVGGNLQANGVLIAHDSKVSVGKTVTAQTVTLAPGNETTDQSKLTAKNLNADLAASGDAQVTISADHTGNLDVRNSANVTISGSSTGDHTVVDGKNATLTVKKDLTNSEITRVSDGSLRVEGSLTNTGTGVGSGITLEKTAALYVGQNTSSNHMSVTGSSNADLGMMEISDIQVGTLGDRTDTSVFTCYSSETNAGNLSAYGKSSTVIRGSILGKITARDLARVEIWGNATSIDVESPATVTFNVANVYGDVTTVTGADQDPLLTMCLAYTQGSQLNKQVSSLRNILSQASNSLIEEMNLGSAIVTALFHHEDINLEKLGIPELEAIGQLASIHPDSLNALLEAGNIDPYAVSLYKESLHKAFLSLDNKNIAPDAFEQKETEFAVNICKGFFGTAKDAAEVLSSDEIKYLHNIFNNGSVSFGEAKEYLYQFGYYTKDSEIIDYAAQRLADLLNFFKGVDDGIEDINDFSETAGKLQQGLDVAGKAFTAMDLMLTGTEFVDFWVRNYQGQIGVLDRMIREQNMTPEMLVAALELRNDYNHKFLSGTLDMVKDVGLKHAANAIKNAHPLYSMVEGTINLVGLLTGITAKTDKLMKGSALTGIVPVLMTNFENSIQAVRNGDTSQDALREVQANYTLLLSGLEEMCKLASDVTGNNEHETIFNDYINQLKNLNIGQNPTTQEMDFD